MADAAGEPVGVAESISAVTTVSAEVAVSVVDENTSAVIAPADDATTLAARILQFKANGGLIDDDSDSDSESDANNESNGDDASDSNRKQQSPATVTTPPRSRTRRDSGARMRRPSLRAAAAAATAAEAPRKRRSSAPTTKATASTPPKPARKSTSKSNSMVAKTTTTATRSKSTKKKTPTAPIASSSDSDNATAERSHSRSRRTQNDGTHRSSRHDDDDSNAAKRKSNKRSQQHDRHASPSRHTHRHAIERRSSDSSEPHKPSFRLVLNDAAAAAMPPPPAPAPASKAQYDPTTAATVVVSPQQQQRNGPIVKLRSVGDPPQYKVTHVQPSSASRKRPLLPSTTTPTATATTATVETAATKRRKSHALPGAHEAIDRALALALSHSPRTSTRSSAVHAATTTTTTTTQQQQSAAPAFAGILEDSDAFIVAFKHKRKRSDAAVETATTTSKPLRKQRSSRQQEATAASVSSTPRASGKQQRSGSRDVVQLTKEKRWSLSPTVANDNANTTTTHLRASQTSCRTNRPSQHEQQVNKNDETTEAIERSRVTAVAALANDNDNDDDEKEDGEEDDDASAVVATTTTTTTTPVVASTAPESFVIPKKKIVRTAAIRITVPTVPTVATTLPSKYTAAAAAATKHARCTSGSSPLASSFSSSMTTSTNNVDALYKQPLQQRRRLKAIVPFHQPPLLLDEKTFVRSARRLNSLIEAARERQTSARPNGPYDVVDTEGNNVPDAVPRLTYATKAQLKAAKHPRAFYGIAIADTAPVCPLIHHPAIAALAPVRNLAIARIEPLVFARRDDRDVYQQKMYGTTFVPQSIRQCVTLIARNIRFTRRTTGFQFNVDRDRTDFEAALAKRYTMNQTIPRGDIMLKNWQAMHQQQQLSFVFLHYANAEDAAFAAATFVDDLGMPLEHKRTNKVGGTIDVMRFTAPATGTATTMPRRSPERSSSASALPAASPAGATSDASSAVPPLRAGGSDNNNNNNNSNSNAWQPYYDELPPRRNDRRDDWPGDRSSRFHDRRSNGGRSGAFGGPRSPPRGGGTRDVRLQQQPYNNNNNNEGRGGGRDRSGGSYGPSPYDRYGSGPLPPHANGRRMQDDSWRANDNSASAFRPRSRSRSRPRLDVPPAGCDSVTNRGAEQQLQSTAPVDENDDRPSDSDATAAAAADGTTTSTNNDNTVATERLDNAQAASATLQDVNGNQLQNEALDPPELPQQSPVQAAASTAVAPAATELPQDAQDVPPAAVEASGNVVDAANANECERLRSASSGKANCDASMPLSPRHAPQQQQQQPSDVEQSDAAAAGRRLRDSSPRLHDNNPLDGNRNVAQHADRRSDRSRSRGFHDRSPLPRDRMFASPQQQRGVDDRRRVSNDMDRGPRGFPIRRGHGGSGAMMDDPRNYGPRRRSRSRSQSRFDRFAPPLDRERRDMNGPLPPPPMRHDSDRHAFGRRDTDRFFDDNRRGGGGGGRGDQRGRSRDRMGGGGVRNRSRERYGPPPGPPGPPGPHNGRRRSPLRRPSPPPPGLHDGRHPHHPHPQQQQQALPPQDLRHLLNRRPGPPQNGGGGPPIRD